MEGLERLRAKFTIDLHPSRLASPTEGVRAHLSSLLLRYSEDLEGVVLSYRNERVLTQAASIHPYFPYVRVQVAADVVLFRPRPGMRLVGTVNKVGADYVGLLVLGFMNAAIAADSIRSEFRPRLAEHCWASSKAAAHRMEVGTKVHFDVAAVRHHGRFVSIAGSLQQPGTGAEGFAKPPKRPAGADKQQRRQQKAAAAMQQQQQQQQDQPQAQEQQAAGKKDRKKKKKQRQQEEAHSAAKQQPEQQEQRQERQTAAPQEAAPSKKAKKNKRQVEQGAAAAGAVPSPAEAAPAAGPAAVEKKKKDKKEKKEKKRKAEEAQTPAAAASNGSTEPQQHKKKKKRKEGA